MKPTDLVDQTSLRTDIPDFGPGDQVKVHEKSFRPLRVWSLTIS